jgi:serine protease Do
LHVWRQGSTKQIDVKVAELADDGSAAEIPSKLRTPDRLGLQLRNPSTDELRRPGIRGGVVIEGVQGAAARAGLQVGDLILAVNHTPVTAVKQFQRLLDSAHGVIALLIQRDGERSYVAVRLRDSEVGAR